MSDVPVAKRRRWRLRLWHLMALMPLAAVATVWLVLPPRGPRAPVRMVRGPDGHLRAERGDLNRRGPLDVNAARIEGETRQLSGSGGSSAVTFGAFADRSLLILNLSDHPLLRQLGGALLEELDAYAPFERVDFLPPGFVPEPGRYAPDLVLTLDLAGFDEDLGPLRHKVDAIVVARIFNELSRGGGDGRSWSSSRADPPLAEVRWEAIYDHGSTTSGPVPSPQRYGLAGAAIAAEIAPDLIGQLGGWAEVHGRLRRLPDAFRPPYREPEGVPALEDLHAERIYATRGLMRHNTTAWRFTDERPTETVLRDLRGRLAPLSWEGAEGLGPGAERLELSREGGAISLVAYRVEPVLVPGVPPDPAEPSTFEVLYVDAMRPDEARTAADLLLDDPATAVEALPMFQGVYDAEQLRRAVGRLGEGTRTEVLLEFSGVVDAALCVRLLELLEGRTIEEPDDWIDVARLRAQAGRPGPSLAAYREAFTRSGWPVVPLDRLARSDALAAEGRGDEAVAVLREAALLDLLVPRYRMLDSAIAVRANLLRVGPDAGALRAEADAANLRAAGYVTVAPGVEGPSGTIGPDAPGLFVATGAEGNPMRLALLVDPGTGELTITTARGSGFSYERRSPPTREARTLPWSVPGVFDAEIRLEPADGTGRYPYAIVARPDPFVEGGP